MYYHVITNYIQICAHHPVHNIESGACSIILSTKCMYLNGNLKKKKKEKKIFTELENKRYVDANERS